MMFAELKLCGTGLLVVVGVLWNIFNFTSTVIQQWRSGGVQTVSLIICSISLSNVLLHLSTFAIVASMSAGVLCLQDVPWFFCVSLVVWLGSSSVSFWSIAWLSVLYCVKVVSFSSALFQAIKKNISSIINVSLLTNLLTSCIMFTPFLFLHYQDDLHVVNATENITENFTGNATCVIRSMDLPAWVDLDVYVVIFTCYLTLLPLHVMLPMSVRLVVYLCKHSVSMKKNQNEFRSAESYLLVCRLTVALVGVYITTLIIISVYYLHTLFASGLSPDMLHYGYSFYCISSAVLLTTSNKYLRDKLRALFC